MASIREIGTFVHDARSHTSGHFRTCNIHDQFRFLQDLRRPRSQVPEGSSHNATIADSSNSRCIAGLLNGNIGVVKGVVGEITDSTNRAQASGLLPLVWAVGVTIGYVTLCLQCTQLSPTCNSPLAGGSLSRPHERFPALFGNWFWEEYPYLLPCLFSAVFCAFCFVLIWLFLKEVRCPMGVLGNESDRPPI